MVILTALCLFLFLAKIQAASAWSHQGATNGVSNWQYMFPTCGGHRQSGVNIDDRKTVYLEDLSPIDFVKIEKGIVKMTNNGHAVVLVKPPEDTLEMLGANLQAEYDVHSVHFHWGSGTNNGSEHELNQHSFPLEMHIVTYNGKKYDDLHAAVNSGDGSALAVLGVLFKVSNIDNPTLAPIVDSLHSVTQQGSQSNMPESFHLSSLIPSVRDIYYRYDGSLTTPPCNEVVTWTVIAQPSLVSHKQLEEFRSLLDSANHSLVDNWRPVQPLNNRTIYRSFQIAQIDILYPETDTDTPVARGSTLPCKIIALVFTLLLVCLL